MKKPKGKATPPAQLVQVLLWVRGLPSVPVHRNACINAAVDAIKETFEDPFTVIPDGGTEIEIEITPAPNARVIP